MNKASQLPRAMSREGTVAEWIRNFCIIAHIDHGKSTLADRLLHLTGCLAAATATPSLDTLPVERLRGITVKAQTVSMLHGRHLLNLMDTPGHVDFGYEVERAMGACQGAVLVVDGKRGVEAQTVACWQRAKSVGLAVVPVVSKIDTFDGDRLDAAVKAVGELVQCDPGRVLRVSARTGENCEQILARVIDSVPCPATCPEGTPLRALVIDSWFDEFRGVVCLVAIKEGQLRRGDLIGFAANARLLGSAVEIGHLTPAPRACTTLHAGHVGYVVTGLKAAAACQVGDTVFNRAERVSALDGFVPRQATVFAGLFPARSDELAVLAKALDKLRLNDPSVQSEPSHSSLLGQGWRLGFLGTLHMDVFRERLKDEFAANCILTTPSVAIKLVLEDGSEQLVHTADKFPDARVRDILEPVVRVAICARSDHIGTVMDLLNEHRASDIGHEYHADQVRLTAVAPLLEIITDFHDKLQSRCVGYASFDYQPCGHRASDICKVRILVNGDPVDQLATLQHASKAVQHGRAMVRHLKDRLDRQQFQVVLQAVVGHKVVARETLSAMRKDVTAKCYGGDGSRKKKLLEAQREGKEKLKRVGRVQVGMDAFVDFFRR